MQTCHFILDFMATNSGVHIWQISLHDGSIVLISCILRLILLADLRGRQWCAPPLGSTFFIFMQILGKIWPLPLWLAAQPLQNPGSITKYNISWNISYGNRLNFITGQKGLFRKIQQQGQSGQVRSSFVAQCFLQIQYLIFLDFFKALIASWTSKQNWKWHSVF